MDITIINQYILLMYNNINIYIVISILAFIGFKTFKFLFKNKVFMDLSNSEWKQSIESDLNYAKGIDIQQKLTGWLPLCLSTDLGKNQVKGFYVLGNDVVAFRASTGKVHVLDAYCPHMGAYLPVGGSVVNDDNIRCPFHGWTFNGDGHCTHVPGLDSSNLPRTKIKTWKCVEINRLIQVWYNENDEEPGWFPSQIEDINKLKLDAKLELIYPGHIEEILYNMADGEHFNTIHSAIFGSGVSAISKDENIVVRFLSKMIRFEFKVKSVPVPEFHRYEFQNNVTIRLFGKVIVDNLKYSFYLDGPYTWHWTFNGGLLEHHKVVVNHTVIPIPGQRSRVIVYNYTGPTIVARIFSKLLLAMEENQIYKDALIWANKKFMKSNNFTKNEKVLVEFVRWLKQFESNNYLK